MSYATYGTTATDSTSGGDGDDGVSNANLAIAIVFSFVGGVILAGLGVFTWLKCGKSAPLGSKADNANNL